MADLGVNGFGGGFRGEGGGRRGEHYGGMVSLGEGFMSEFFIHKKIIFKKGTERIYTPFCFLTTEVSVFKFLNTSKLIYNCMPIIQFIQIM